MADRDQNLSKPRRSRKKGERSLPLAVVGVGVSAESIASLETLFASLGTELGAAYIVALRQVEGLRLKTVLESLSKHSPLPVKVAKNGDTIEANCVYVGGSDDTVTLEDGTLRTRAATEPIGQRAAVDTMLISLAEQVQDRTVAVILAGLGTDGTAGVTATKKFGGLSIAEFVEGQEEAATQGATGPRGIVDLLLPVGRIADEIALYVANLAIVDEAGPDELPEKHASQIAQIATILRNVTGNDFHGYKRNTFFRRIQRRMQVSQISSIDAYVDRLRGDREEVQHLFQDLLIGVTQFFRDPAEFELIERELPRLFEGKATEDQFRVWVLGCATGEEAYSLAILLREYLETLEAPPHVQIFATDLDARALGAARAGRYSDSIAAHIRPDRLARWFVKEGETYCVAKELREMCIFSPHNIVKDAPFSRIDLLSCRNLLIYLNAELQSRVVPIFHFSLRPGGVLFLGSSENVTRHQKLFAPVDRKNRVFRRLDTATRILPDFPISPRARTADTPQQATPAIPRPGSLSGTLSRRAENIAERYAPAYVVVDDQYEILHFSGRTGRYLDPTAGVASLSLLNLVQRELRLDLRSALHRAAAEKTRVEMPFASVNRDGQSYSVKIVVEPLGQDRGAFVVLFQEQGTAVTEPVPEGGRLISDEHVQRLEGELRLTKERLQATIEELESTNEELKSSNEEYQSINEELQSANEELETSKEELQSVNEELQTVNGELAHRVGELARTNSDLKNFLEATQIATLFLDGELRVRNFTPAATEIFHLLDTDLGRPIGHVASRTTYPELTQDVHEVLKTLATVEREVAGADGAQYNVRVRPYRSVDNFIAGVVVTFVNVTDRHRSEAALRQSETRFRALSTAGGHAIYRMSPDWATMYELDGNDFLVSSAQPTNDWLGTYIVEEERDAISAAVEAAIQSKSLFELEHRVRRADGSLGWTSSRAVPILNQNGEITEWFGAATDEFLSKRLLFAASRQVRRRSILIRKKWWAWQGLNLRPLRCQHIQLANNGRKRRFRCAPVLA
ncbi:MAG: PAS domain-containing protein, partial [Sphingomonas sp.]|nr:PAS domain-containing protein [Sphingomonas sp.]